MDFRVLHRIASQAPPPNGDLLFRDQFNYVADRNAASNAAFVAAGWATAKSHAWDGGNGYLSTETSIPGFGGSFPHGGPRVLRIEALPNTLGAQTDFYLQLGDGNTPDYIPGNVYFQYWLYPQNFGSELSSRGTRNKWMYASNGPRPEVPDDPPYPSHSHKWMISEHCDTRNPHNSFPDGNPGTRPWLNLSSAEGRATVTYTPPNEKPDTIGMQDITTESLVMNRWTKVRMRMDTSTTSGLWQVWLQPQGGSQVQVANWQNGVDGLIYTIPAEYVGGHTMMRFPSTVGTVSSTQEDYYMYMADFAMATSAAALPVY